MKVYSYHPNTKEFVDESEADESPLEPNVFLLPALSTFQKPPSNIPSGFVAIWNTETSTWSVVEKKIDVVLEELQIPNDWDILRAQRNLLLQETDYLFLRDAPLLNTEVEANFRIYRQSLRDLPSITTDPTKPNWPTRPNVV